MVKLYTHVRWKWHWKDADWTLNTILTSLSTLDLHHSIKEFTFCYDPQESQRGLPISLPLLHNIQVLSVAVNVTTSAFTSLIEHPLTYTSTLKSLHLRGEMIQRGRLKRDIPLTISDVRLYGIVFEISQIAHRNITSLDIGHAWIPFADLWNALDGLWNALCHQQIYLLRLVIRLPGEGQDADSLFNYLESYSGLELLSIHGPSSNIQPGYNNSAVRFYSSVLSMHERTLVDLEVKPFYESMWCFGMHNEAAFRRCKKLRNLEIRIDGLGHGSTHYVVCTYLHFLFVVPDPLHEEF